MKRKQFQVQYVQDFSNYKVLIPRQFGGKYISDGKEVFYAFKRVKGNQYECCLIDANSTYTSDDYIEIEYEGARTRSLRAWKKKMLKEGDVWQENPSSVIGEWVCKIADAEFNRTKEMCDVICKVVKNRNGKPFDFNPSIREDGENGDDGGQYLAWSLNRQAAKELCLGAQ